MGTRARFWANLQRLEGPGGRSSLIHYSVFQTIRRRVAVAAKKLAEHYGASTEVFKGQKTDP